jgi:toxin-antitoxin system PIN domain toxin
VIGIDTNILVYARRRETPHHEAAVTLVRELAQGRSPWAIPWPCVYEFLRVVTHPRVFNPPTLMANALKDLASLMAAPTLSMLGEGPAHPGHLLRVVGGGAVRGNLVHDAHIAALALEHGVTDFLTCDRDFSRFPGLRSRDPFRA